MVNERADIHCWPVALSSMSTASSKGWLTLEMTRVGSLEEACLECRLAASSEKCLGRTIFSKHCYFKRLAEYGRYYSRLPRGARATVKELAAKKDLQLSIGSSVEGRVGRLSLKWPIREGYQLQAQPSTKKGFGSTVFYEYCNFKRLADYEKARIGSPEKPGLQ
ncbi:hypothetical protein AMTR_s00002p00064320 [Amborella trichopoda]|uniref:Uncharacterized protein n=1 Tax=Amborella trichopoda TaxID=13333 RepID=W1NTQ9_AMBTC|nr:hypothetical protein AMTR_s00002p00064320 [Amborella trichopoda]